jgi:uncharacterized membrane protein
VTGAATSPAATVRRGRRLTGVDAARGLALVGMMSVHILPPLDPDGSVSSAYAISSGRASALFAVLAGVGLALLTGREKPPAGAPLAAARRGIAARAAVVAAVGLTLGGLPTGLAIILVHYGVLFLAALPFLGLRWRALAVTAGAWLLLAPLLAHALRSRLPVGPGPQPDWEMLVTDPRSLVELVLLTGYYPVLPWTGYLLVGLAVGRTGLRTPRVAAAVTATGAIAAAAAWGASALALGPFGGSDRLAANVPPGSLVARLGLEESLATSLYGTTPTTSWWWLAVVAPHSGTPPDLLHTAGTALLVLGGCLLVAPVAARSGVLAAGAVRMLAAAGSTTLTLYTVHALALAAVPAATVDRGRLLAVHVVLALTAAAVWRALGLRGPLESVAAAAARATGGRPAPRAP